MMKEKTPYDMLPNALRPEQIEKWKKYYADVAKHEACCKKADVSALPQKAATPSAP